MKMARTLLVALLPLSSASLTLACSAAPPDELESSSEAEGELRALGPSEVVGDIAYGTHAMEVQHPGDTKKKRVYRAVRFTASAGDVIDARLVGGNAADPVLYLLADDFRTLRSNDDRAPGQKDSELGLTIAKSGTYYLAFRTKEGWATKFYVSLDANAAVAPTPAPEPPPPQKQVIDLFADAVSGAASLPSSEIAHLFQPGASTARLGDFVLVERRRTCNAATGCGPFAAITRVKDLYPRGGSLGTWWDASTVHMPSGQGEVRGTSTLRTTADGAIVLDLASTAEGDVQLQGAKLGSIETSWLGTEAQWCQKTSDYVNPVHCYGGSYLVEIGPWDADDVRFRSLAGVGYVYGRSNLITTRDDAAGSHFEMEYAFIASTTAGKAISVEATQTSVSATF